MITTKRMAHLLLSAVVPVAFLLATQSALRYIALAQAVDLSVASSLLFVAAPFSGAMFFVWGTKRYAVAGTLAYLVVMSIVVTCVGLEWSRAAYGDGP